VVAEPSGDCSDPRKKKPNGGCGAPR
jgi:hypothetical protein